MTTDLWSVWMKMPNTEGRSRIAGDMTEEEALLVQAKLLFPARAMPDQAKD